MSKKKADRKTIGRNKNDSLPQTDLGRRKLVLLGVGAVAATGVGIAGAYNAGWFETKPSPQSGAQSPSGKNLSPLLLAADSSNALRAVNEMLEHYARDLGNASVLIHAIRGFGRRFTLADGTSAVAHLCSRYVAEKEVNNKRYIFFKRDAEVHENSMLKSVLGAGVSQDQAIKVGGNKYTLRDLADSGKALFRCDPKDLYRFDSDSFRYDPTPQPPRRDPDGKSLDTKGELVHEHLP